MKNLKNTIGRKLGKKMAAQVVSSASSVDATPPDDDGAEMGINDQKWQKLQSQLDVSQQM